LLKEILGYKKISDLLLAAKEAALFYRENKQYVIMKKAVIIRDELTGEIKHGERFSRGISSFIEIGLKKSGRDVTVNTETLIASVLTPFEFYRRIPGYSGVLGETDFEVESVLKNNYGAKIHIIEPHYSQMTRINKDPRYFGTRKEVLDYTFDCIRRIHTGARPARPILVNLASLEEVYTLRGMIIAAGFLRRRNDLRCIDGLNRDGKEALYWETKGSPYAITLTAQLASRGDEIKIEPSLCEPVNISGLGNIAGLVLISTYHSPCERIDNNLQARTGRLGKAGTVISTDSIKDNRFLNQYAVSELKELMDAFPRSFFKERDRIPAYR
jgi:preprotein translocase subunit SecA